MSDATKLIELLRAASVKGGMCDVAAALIEQQATRIAELEAQIATVAPAGDAPTEDAQPVAWRYLTPTGWHATTDVGKALGAAEHHDMEPLYSRAPTEAKDES